MYVQKLDLFSVLCCFLLSMLSGQQVVVVRGRVLVANSNSHPSKLFVFGDSYSDTGNTDKTQSAWEYPYGITFPGKPAGRFSSGRVLTDFFDLESSMTLVTLAGNDYSTYIVRNGSAQGWKPCITAVVNQLAINLRRIHGMGVKKIVVNALQPLGCAPSNTAKSSFQQCNETENSLVVFHNLLLQQAVTKLNSEAKDSNPFVILDLYDSFLSVIKNKGGTHFENPLKPCCFGISSKYNCGSVDENGAKKYTVCEDPESAFFWDGVHPTQAGWTAVYSVLRSTDLQH
ncbi:GDSL esterase/lipase At5g03610-like isoform X3 [Carya illinoinensis]|uniref:GDSL esterase/lipase At5g03610-like isoform X3 n=1 Tax=Carya illinoinensis TaxID=32201 RepID=UPI001C722280|nr:GDSL esterase/lipase At5g03610-like isoform X3 [Carya illinoinensis]